MDFTELGLGRGLAAALDSLGMREAMPVQALAIPPALQGRDLLVLSPTGSGKTVAFAAPLFQAFLDRGGSGEAQAARDGAMASRDSGRAAGPDVAALVLVPTRELAIQVASVLEAISKALPAGEGPRVRLAFGGVSPNPQMLALRGGADILVATPGRLLDLARRNAARLGAVRRLVLDEADRMLDQGFADELGEVLALLPRERQTLLYSATFREATAALLSPALRDPVRLGEEAMPAGTGEAIVHRAYSVAPEDKGPALRRILAGGFAEGWDRVLVFTASNRRADNVARKLNNNGIGALALHGDLTQAARTKAMADFRSGRIKVLVASDLASRGLDVEGLPCVINYEFARSPHDYVHRAGRTGRAGSGGLVISLVAPEDEAMLRLIEKRTGIAIPLTPPSS